MSFAWTNFEMYKGEDLIENFMEDCILMDKIRTEDPEGGYSVEYVPSVPIKAAIVKDTSTLQQIAEKQGVTGSYTITTRKNIMLSFPDVIKRVRDGRYFRVTTRGGDKVAPDVSSINLAQVQAEACNITDLQREGV